MVKKSYENQAVKNYKKTGIVAAVVIAVAALGVWGVSALNSYKTASVATAIEEVSADAANAANMRIAVIRMDAIQNGATALKDLRAQKEKYENELREELTRDQKALEKEKAERIYNHLSVYTHGLAILFAQKTNIYTLNEAEEMIIHVFKALMKEERGE
jgi:methylthioribose-1-phosphate isomerase